MNSVTGTPVSDKPKDVGPTPGPHFFEPIPEEWYTDPEFPARRDDLFQIVDSNAAGEVLAIVQKVSGGFEEAQANARLYAAAWELRRALLKAVETIRAFHGIGFGGEAEARMWQLYQSSPEMQQINAALRKVDGL
jgi:hypothetical protein